MNVKYEFLEEVGNKEVLCVELDYGSMWLGGKNLKRFCLQKGYTEEQFERFLDSIDFGYDAGFGGQELFGFIWYTDGTWSERGEYDGSEWWEHRQAPEIPEYLMEEK